MARAAAVANRTADEVEERRKRRREANTASKRQERRKAADDEAEDAVSESETGESEGGGESEGDAEALDLDDGTDLVERRRDERRHQAWLDAGCPSLDDTAEYERLQAERRADEWNASGQPDDGRGVFALPFAELERRVGEGLLTRPVKSRYMRYIALR